MRGARTARVRRFLSEVEFTLNGDLAELGHLAAETAKFCEMNSLDAGVEFDLNLVLEELFTNVVRHGGGQGLPGVAHIRLEVVGPDAIVRFSDRGTAFNPLVAPGPALEAPLESRRAGGLGIHLVRQIMQDLLYERSDGWNRIAMRRRVSEITAES
jgi:serine/threonine-protein kinase RsbW